MTQGGPSLGMLRKIRRYSRERMVDGEVYSIRNPRVLFRRAGTLELTDGTRLPFDAATKASVVRLAMFALDHGVRFGQGPGAWRLESGGAEFRTPRGIRFRTESLDPTIFAETFLYDVHFVDYEFRGQSVVEAGAFVGDTALYFAERGATVYSFEPDPRSFDLARQNLALNPTIAERVTLRNWAIGTDGDVQFPVARNGSGSSSLARAAAEHVTIRSVSIGTILSELRVESPYLLHLDIKGQEFAALRDPALAKFRRIRMEYSPYLLQAQGNRAATLGALVERLTELGFRELRVFKHNDGRYDLVDHGTIDARRTP